tara:strand:- start:644 stop:793 length:150 start_codon:yes stop_codon:yes gene_type:complete
MQVQQLTKHGAHVVVTLVGQQEVVYQEHLVIVIIGQNAVLVVQAKVAQE